MVTFGREGIHPGADFCHTLKGEGRGHRICLGREAVGVAEVVRLVKTGIFPKKVGTGSFHRTVSAVVIVTIVEGSRLGVKMGIGGAEHCVGKFLGAMGGGVERVDVCDSVQVCFK